MKEKLKPKSKQTNKLNIVSLTSLVIGTISLMISIILGINTIFYQRPINNELEQIKEDFPIVQDYYEATQIAKNIPLPDDPTRNLNYMTLIDFNDQNPGSFREPRFVLRLNTDLNTYLATNSQNSTAKVVFSIDELRMNRGIMFWRVLAKDKIFPPAEWSQ